MQLLESQDEDDDEKDDNNDGDGDGVRGKGGCVELKYVCDVCGMF